MALLTQHVHATVNDLKDSVPHNAHFRGNALGNMGRPIKLPAFKETVSQIHMCLLKKFYFLLKLSD